MNYEDNLRIDEDALDLECLDQPMRFLEVAKANAQAQFEVDEAKNKLELVAAEVDASIRNEPDKYGISKITETLVANAVKMTKEYKEQLEDFNKVKFNAAVIRSAMMAFEQRKTMLELLVKLNGQSYFAGPSVPRDIQSERAKKEQKSATVTKRMMKRRKKGDD